MSVYIIPIVSIVVGLAITDLAASFHRLLRKRDIVTWDWLVLLLALNLLLLILINWWFVYKINVDGAFESLWVFIPLIISFLLQYIWTASVLPDQIPPEGIDLKQYYAANSAYIWWSGFSVLLFGAFANATRLAASSASIDFLALITSPDVSKLLALSIITIFLAMIKKRAFHMLMIVLMLAVLLVDAALMNGKLIE
ncbi:MAG: hypothetical protein AAF564_23995 [Bacteroidota bacterium]